MYTNGRLIVLPTARNHGGDTLTIARPTIRRRLVAAFLHAPKKAKRVEITFFVFLLRVRALARTLVALFLTEEMAFRITRTYLHFYASAQYAHQVAGVC